MAHVAHIGLHPQIHVLATGENLFIDTGDALLANPEVAEAFLGGHANNKNADADG